MGLEYGHVLVKLVIAALYSEKEIYNQVRNRLLETYGTTDYESPDIAFDYTDYYNEEMGPVIRRVFLSFERLITIEDLVAIKIATNRLEEEYALSGKRKVNLDPAYLSLGKFVLATTKDQQHRLYIGLGIYEEITLYYRNRGWTPHEWTYYDYRSERYNEILYNIRRLYKSQLDKNGLNQKKIPLE